MKVGMMSATGEHMRERGREKEGEEEGGRGEGEKNMALTYSCFALHGSSQRLQGNKRLVVTYS